MGLTSPALDQLKTHVAEAAEEIVRLRSENEQLSESLQSLWKTGDDAQRGASLAFDEDRDQLREKIERYIAIIDRHLEHPV